MAAAAAAACSFVESFLGPSGFSCSLAPSVSLPLETGLSNPPPPPAFPGTRDEQWLVVRTCAALFPPLLRTSGLGALLRGQLSLLRCLALASFGAGCRAGGRVALSSSSAPSSSKKAEAGRRGAGWQGRRLGRTDRRQGWARRRPELGLDEHVLARPPPPRFAAPLWKASKGAGRRAGLGARWAAPPPPPLSCCRASSASPGTSGPAVRSHWAPRCAGPRLPPSPPSSAEGADTNVIWFQSGKLGVPANIGGSWEQKSASIKLGNISDFQMCQVPHIYCLLGI